MPEEIAITPPQTEVVSAGQPGVTTQNLASLFDQMETARSEGRGTEEVIQEAQKQEKQEAKPEVKADKPERKEAVVEDKPAETPDDKTEAKKDDKPDDPREVLRKAMEERAERKKEEKQPEKKEEKAQVKDEKKEDDVSEDELQVLPHDKPKTAKRIQALLKRIEAVSAEATKTKAEATEKAAKLAELEKKLQTTQSVDPKVQEEIQKTKDELAMYRRKYELDRDPTVKQRFDSRIEVAEQSIVDSLKKRGASDALLSMIKEEGGWEKFASSSRQVALPDGKTLTGAELADAILGQLPLGERKAIEAAMLEQVTTKRERDRFLKEEQDKASEYFKKREEEEQKAAKAQQEQVETAKRQVEEWKGKVLQMDFIKDKEVPEGATPEQKAAIEEHNRYNAQLRSLFNKNVGVNSLEGMFELQVDALRYYDERRTSNALKREVERLKAELEAKEQQIVKFKSGSRSVPRSGSIATAPAAVPANRKPVGLEAALEALERGERLDGNPAQSTDDE